MPGHFAAKKAIRSRSSSSACAASSSGTMRRSMRNLMIGEYSKRPWVFSMPA